MRRVAVSRPDLLSREVVFRDTSGFAMTGALGSIDTMPRVRWAATLLAMGALGASAGLGCMPQSPGASGAAGARGAGGGGGTSGVGGKGGNSGVGGGDATGGARCGGSPLGADGKTITVT